VSSDDSVMVLVNREEQELTADFMLPGIWPDKWNGRPVADELNGKTVTITGGHLELIMAPESVSILSAGSAKVDH